MTPTARALQHDRSAFLAELRTASVARRMHEDYAGRLEIDRTITAIEADQAVENQWTDTIARRFLHGIPKAHPTR